MAKSKLLSALDAHKGRDFKLEHQKKLQKQAAKRKEIHNAKSGQEDEVDGNEETEGVALEAADKKEGDAVDGVDDDWESDTDEEAEGGFDLSRLDDSDTSESEDDDETSTNPVKNVLALLKANGIPLPEAPTAQVDDDEEMADDADDVDDVDDASDIPLSEISDTGSATEDIIPHQRLTINNTTALTRAHAAFALPLTTLPFSEHQSITTSAPVDIPDVEDDLNRELAFYSQALSSVKEARRLLSKEGGNFTRPTDYFAEMVKSDEHMGKIKAKLVDDAASKRASADARRQRDLKKFGKQVQQEKLQERAKDKRDMLEKVNILKRKRQGAGLDDAAADGEGLFDVALDDAATTDRKDRDAKRQGGRGGARGGGAAGARGGRGGSRGGSERGGFGARGGRGGARGGRDGDDGPNPKRAKKDEKFGFGGKKRFGKSGDAASSADMSGYSVKRMKGSGGRGGSSRGGSSRGGSSRGGASKRVGKDRRAKMR